MTEERFRKAFLILLVVAISAAFLAMIRMFLLTILLTAIVAGLARPLYLRVQRRLGGNQPLASVATIVLLLVLILLPLSLLAGAVTQQAVRVAGNVTPWIETQLKQPQLFDDVLRRLPYADRIEPFRAEILTRGAELVGSIGTWLANALSAFTRGTVLFFFQFFLFLYTLFFFLKDGPQLLASLLAYVPLAEEDKQRIVERFRSVARATLKGTVLIGTIQGVLSGLAFWAVGIDGAIFWTTVMVVLSIVPGIGAALVWVPAVILLVIQGAVWQGLAMALYCALLVGSVDNILRPRMVGRDTQMHDLLILFSTLGGLMLFGVTGFVLGPILAALFVAVWEMFGVAFRDVLANREAPPTGTKT
jgi:predicted PurR-regulated permease PerM